jgi:hypothetical protein
VIKLEELMKWRCLDHLSNLATYEISSLILIQISNHTISIIQMFFFFFFFFFFFLKIIICDFSFA